MHLLVDADSAIYKAGLSNETRKYLAIDEDGNSLAEFRYKKDFDLWLSLKEEPESIICARDRTVGPLAYTLGNLKRIITDKMLSIEHTSYQLYIQGKDNFRYDIYPEYKGNRQPDTKPVHMKEMEKYLIERWGAIVVDGEETDDRVSILHSTMPIETCIVTIDKDLLNTPGWNYNYDKCLLVNITKEEAELNFARQLLTGDSTDNIPGLAGVGAKTAEKLLPEWRKDWLDVVREEYTKHYKMDADATLERNGILLWMRRKEEEMWSIDYEFS